ncbi:Eukaryotic initiation factor 5C [Giardia muris]|uniref:Eukaryotic initiation factor 5C n=1 Tax=Giardia muris TaxID=5742 RepID=A0A4Z1T524_GIAMU|nr:Eukaryotic initiation factor 5C [Giardia muris]|eukprot:TNJ27551.1 Eukaryotic initiation factor 5C [Giardia muris]
MSRPIQGAVEGSRVRTRKRHIVVQKDPESFLALLEPCLEGTLDDIAVKLDSADLDYKLYNEFLFDRLISGSVGLCFGRADAAKQPLSPSLLSGPIDEAKDWATLLEKLLRKKRYLRDPLNETAGRVMLCIDTVPQYTEHITHLCAYLASFDLLGSSKTTEFFLLNLLRIRNVVLSGQALSIVSSFSNKLSEIVGVDAAWACLVSGDVVTKLNEFAPEEFSGGDDIDAKGGGSGFDIDRFLRLLEEKYGLDWFSTQYRRMQSMRAIKKLQDELTESFLRDGAVEAEVYKKIDAFADSAGLSNEETVELVWNAVSQCFKGRDIPATLRRLTPYLLKYVGDDLRTEAKLLSLVQSTCYENPSLIDGFKPIVMMLYDAEVIEGDVIVEWFNSDSGQGRAAFNHQLADFVNWLQMDLE